MPITTISSRVFNQDVGKAKRAASNGPVFITDRGNPSFVLLSIERYEQLTHQKDSIIDLLAMPDAYDIDFIIPAYNKKIYNPEDFK